MQTDVFPTPVGVFLCFRLKKNGGIGLPHTRGGVSVTSKTDMALFWSSPHPWGCFFRRIVKRGKATVFPTPVGVFLQLPSS